tara:strand:- start:2 stop:286 length:285 start_codon:yes stop_codon:yes gene_type:complete
MKVKELMERVGTTNFGFTKAYINDGMREINSMIEESVNIAKANLVKDQRYYALSDDDISGIVKVLNVSILDTDDGIYHNIGRVVGSVSVDKDQT